MFSKDEIMKRQAEKFSESLSKMKQERDDCINGAQQVTKNLNQIEKLYYDESYENLLTNETATMEKLLSSVEMNSLKTCSALEDVNNILNRLTLESYEPSTSTASAAESGAAAGAMVPEEFLSMQDTELISKNNKVKIDAAAVKLKEIFLKATNQYHAVLASFSTVTSHDAHDLNLDSSSTATGAPGGGGAGDHHGATHGAGSGGGGAGHVVSELVENHHLNHLQSLQKRIKELKKELEISEMKSRSVIVQRYSYLSL
jgi:hypothetical protein